MVQLRQYCSRVSGYDETLAKTNQGHRINQNDFNACMKLQGIPEAKFHTPCFPAVEESLDMVKNLCFAVEIQKVHPVHTKSSTWCCEHPRHRNNTLFQTTNQIQSARMIPGIHRYTTSALRMS